MSCQYLGSQTLPAEVVGCHRGGRPEEGSRMRRILSVAAVLAAAVPLGPWKSAPSGAEGGGMEISRDESRPATPGPAETFTGEVSVKPLFDTNDARDFSSAQ